MQGMTHKVSAGGGHLTKKVYLKASALEQILKLKELPQSVRYEVRLKRR